MAGNRSEDRGTSVRAQYEKAPYPTMGLKGILGRPIPAAACALSYEFGQYLRTGHLHEHRGARILVAGCGTWEPIVVAKVHPRAEITAVDFSRASLEKLRSAQRLHGVSSKQLRLMRADLLELTAAELGEFDYIVCTGVLHHTDQPQRMLAILTTLLKPTGVLRLMTYASHSRFWIRQTAEFFRAAGLTATTPGLFEKANAILPQSHPYRSAFESYSDIHTKSGLIDGFFHALENPLSVLDLGHLCEENSLHLCGYGHAYHSQPHWLERLLARDLPSMVAAYQELDPWTRLEVLDQLGELACNPVLWLGKTLGEVRVSSTQNSNDVEPILNPAFRPTVLPRSVPAPLFPDLQFSKSRSTWWQGVPEHDRDEWLASSIFLSNSGTLPEKLARERSRLGPRADGHGSHSPTPQPAADALSAAILAKLCQSEHHSRPSSQRSDLLSGIRWASRQLEGTTTPALANFILHSLGNEMLQSLAERGLSSEEIVSMIEYFPEIAKTPLESASERVADARFWFY